MNTAKKVAGNLVPAKDFFIKKFAERKEIYAKKQTKKKQCLESM